MYTSKTSCSYFSRLLLCLSLLSLSISSCSDKNENATPEEQGGNQATYSDQHYSLNAGAISKNGIQAGHFNYSFFLFELGSESDPVVPLTIFMDLFSPSMENFKGGTFHYLSPEATQEDTQGQYYFNQAYVVRNFNRDQENADEVAFVQSGTIKASGADSHFTLEFDLILDNGKTLKGHYDGEFEPANLNNAVASLSRQYRLEQSLLCRLGRN